MGRPFLALGLITIAALLLGTLFVELEDQIRDPDAFSPDPKAAEQLAKGAAQHPEVLQTAAEADMLRLLEDAEITIPPGAAEVDGDLLRLLEDVEWTVPAGTEIDDLTLPIPPGTEIDLPEGTRIDGDTFVFPPGSEITLADGTVLELPEGGTLRIPDADRATMQRALSEGRLTVPASGGIFDAPRVHTQDDWPATLPKGTTFRIPDEWTLPEGVMTEGGTFQIPAGHEIETGSRDASAGTEAGTTDGGLFDKIGKIDLKPSEPETSESGDGSAGPGFNGIPGGKAWLWVLGLAALALLAFLVYRNRRHLRSLLPTRAAVALGAAPPRHPYRLVARIDDRSELLPLAVAPGETRRLHLRIERRRKEDDAVVWRRVGADIVLQVDDTRIHSGTVTPEGIETVLPALPAGDHTLSVRVRMPDHKPVTLDLTVRVASWDEHVARDYDRLAAAAHSATRLPDGFTPRILESHLVPRLPPAALPALSGALTVFERANYSLATIREEEWTAMAGIVERILGILAPAPSPVRPAAVTPSRAPKPAE